MYHGVSRRCIEYLLKFSARHMDREGHRAILWRKINHENVKPVMIQAVHRNLALNREEEGKNLFVIYFSPEDI